MEHHPLTRQHSFEVQTAGRGTYDLSQEIARIVADSGVRTGMCHIFVQHTSASLIICENADPTVRSDLESFMARTVPDGADYFQHRAEGPDDMPAHVKAALTATSISIPISDGQLALGTWQGIFLWEHRHSRSDRKVIVHIS